ncbi:MAG: hypothetical protein ACREO3_12480 [Arenimonas sp.]
MNPDPAELRLPGRTTPTWDMELLVSAASVFALVQLPGWLDQLYVAVRPRLDTTWDVLFRILYTYGKIGLLILAAAFALHLAMRAYWIALVGMDSIYPGGVRWDQLRLGARRRQFSQAQDEPMAVRIERADNRSSIVFALGITMAMAIVVLVPLVGLAYLIAIGLSVAFDWTWLTQQGFLWVLLVAALPYLLASLVDRRLGAKLPADGRVARAIDAVYAAYARVGYGRGGNPTMHLVQSHAGERRTTVLTLLAMGFCVVVAALQFTAQQDGLALGDYARWPAAEAGLDDSLVSAHYRDQLAPDSPLVPTIDSAFPKGDYLTVVVPFDPRRHPLQLARNCPREWTATDSPARRAALLDCFARWLAPQLDGQPLPGVRARYFTDPRTGQQAWATVVPIGGLAAGEHELRLVRAPPRSPDAPREPPGYRIVFWR